MRHVSTLAEYEECVRIQLVTWGEDLATPSGLFVVARETGGQTLGAFAGEKMVGFTLGLAGFHDGKPIIHSHMTAVLSEFRDRGIGRMLKLAQRSDALARGIHLVAWTFDPLELKNAHFNINRLGAVVKRYIPNCYGITDSPLHAGLPTDRV
ncbi:MAG: GNAT family N-acetyltransferase, partial [Candidatus Acidiferrales bacterium]